MLHSLIHILGGPRREDRDVLISMLARQVYTNPQLAIDFERFTSLEASGISLQGYQAGDPTARASDMQQQIDLMLEVLQLCRWWKERDQLQSKAA